MAEEKVLNGCYIHSERPKTWYEVMKTLVTAKLSSNAVGADEKMCGKCAWTPYSYFLRISQRRACRHHEFSYLLEMV